VDAVLNWLWQGCVIAVATAALLRWLPGARAQTRYVVCWAALAAIVIVPLLPFVGPTAASRAPIDALPTSSSYVVMPASWWTSNTVALLICATWLIVYGARLVSAMVALRRTKRRCRVFPSQVESRLAHWTDVKGRGRLARLVLSNRVRAAAVLGAGRCPTIAVAPTLVRHLAADDLDRVIIHEWAHVQRHDDVAHVVQLAIRAIVGWHPAVWWLDRRLHIEREMACDEATVALTGSPKRYAACLAKLASLPQSRAKALPALGALSSPALTGRIARILSPREPASPLWYRSIAIIGVVMLCSLSWTVGGLTLVETVETAVLSSTEDEARSAPMTPMQRLAFEGTRAIVETVAAAAPADAVTMPRAPARSSRPIDPVDHPAPASSRDDAQTATPSQPATTDFLRDTRLQPVDATIPQAPASAATAAPPTVLSAASTAPAPTPPPAADTKAVTPWGAAANAGIAVGKGSQKSAVATAGFFTRFGKKVAASF
jgi:beta-lactamase regulating signal transducer with metallopeptidase domain